jgi:hypothetical protein
LTRPGGKVRNIPPVNHNKGSFLLPTANDLLLFGLIKSLMVDKNPEGCFCWEIKLKNAPVK